MIRIFPIGKRFWPRLITGVFFGALATIVAGCSQAEQSAAVVRSETRGQIENCLFIILDASAANHFGAWGYDRDTTPNIDALAKEGFVFRNAHSQAESTMPSTFSFLTGRYPLRPPSIELTSESHRIREEDVSMAKAFQKAGFRTVGFSQNPFIRERWGYDSGFDEFRAYSVVSKTGRDPRLAAQLFQDAKELIENARSDGKGWFCYIHHLRPHAPYTAPPPYGDKFMRAEDPPSEDWRHNTLTTKSFQGERIAEDEIAYMVNSYDGGLAYADFEIGEFIGWLKEKDMLSNTLIVIASDHGESFAQHGRFGHGYYLWEELLHVPLLFWAPRGSNLEIGESDTLVEMVDVYPTLVELFDLTPPSYRLDGQSLMPAMRGEPFNQKEFSYAQIFDGGTISARRGDMKLIAAVERETLKFYNIGLIDLSKDPGERNNLYPAVSADDLLQAAADYVERWRASTTLTEASPGDVPQNVIDELEALGYLRE